MNQSFRAGSKTLVEVVSPRTILRGNIVLLRLETSFGYANTWWEIMMFEEENNGQFSFIGKLTRKHHDYTNHCLGEYQKWPLLKIRDILKIGDNFCYSDNVTICNCKGLCKNKY